jgi:protein phosphatase
VDSRSKNVETILLLFALKIKFPEKNSPIERIGKSIALWASEMNSQPNLKKTLMISYSFFSRVNRIFEKLPIAAVIDQNIFCCHGGIGHT